MEKVNAQFRLDLDGSRISFVKLSSWRWLEASRYPRFTLVGQTIGSLWVAFQALRLHCPDVFIDTTGYGFVYPLARLFGCKVVAYVHYPIISTDMINRVSLRVSGFNNDDGISSSVVLTTLKTIYYKVLAVLYGWAGSHAHIVMVNSSWTRNHIQQLWNPKRLKTVFPPCDTRTLCLIPFGNRSKVILSVAQFRPEKNHTLQIQAFAELINRGHDVSLVMIGGVRNKDDQDRVDNLKKLSQELGISDRVHIHMNAPYETLLEYLKTSSIGLHTMRDEHFGISVIEYMASGLVTVAHDSAGPALDILTLYNGERTGFLASDLESFVDAMDRALSLSRGERIKLGLNARESILARFSEPKFKHDFLACLKL